MNTIARRAARALGLTLSCLVLCPGPAHAQPDRPGTDTRRQDAERRDRPERTRPAAMEPDHLRVRLVSMRDHLQGALARIDKAIETLDQDGSAEEAIESLGGPERTRRLAEFWSGWARGVEPAARDGRGPDADDDGPSRAEVFAFLERHASEMAERLRELRAQDARRAEFFLSRLEPRVAEIMATHRQDPELGELMLREFRLSMALLDAGRRYARALEAGHESADALGLDLRRLAAEHTDVRLARREYEIASLERRIESLRGEFAEQLAQRDEFIDRIVERTRAAAESGDTRQRRRSRPRDD